MIQRLFRTNPANPGANATGVLFDDNGDLTLYATTLRVFVTACADQTFTLEHWWAKNKDSALHRRSTESITTTAVHPSTAITCVAVANLVNNDYFTVTVSDAKGESTTANVFEYKVDGDFVATEGRPTIDVSAKTTANEVAVASAAAVLAEFTGLITVPAPEAAVFTATHVSSGTAVSCSATENVANAGFTVAPTSGVNTTLCERDFRLLPGRNKIVAITTTAPTEFDVAVETVDDAAKSI